MKTQFKNVFFLLFLCPFSKTVLAWDTAPQIFNQQTIWGTETFYSMIGAADFKYVDDGTSQVRYSLTPPVEGSTGGSVFIPSRWNTLDGKVVFRASVVNMGGNNYQLSQSVVGGVTRDDKNNLHSGIFYLWYGKQTMATVNWTMYYDPFPVISVPSGVIDLGTCHKSVSGTILTKPVNSTINVYGYLNGLAYSASRSLTFANLPAGASFTESTGTIITTGNTQSLQSSISAPPLVINDTFIAKLDCDQATVGAQTWSANVTYTVQ